MKLTIIENHVDKVRRRCWPGGARSPRQAGARRRPVPQSPREIKIIKIKGVGERRLFTLLARPAVVVTSLLPPRARRRRRQNGSPGGWQSCRRGRPSARPRRRSRSAGRNSPSANASCRTSTHRCYPRPARPGTAGGGASRAGGSPPPPRRGGQGRRPRPLVPSAAAEEEEEEWKKRGGGEEEKKHGAASYLWCGAGNAGPGAARRGGGALADRPRSPHCAPRARTMSSRGPRSAGSGPTARRGRRRVPRRWREPSSFPPILLLLLAQEFLNFKEQVPSTCPAFVPRTPRSATEKLRGRVPPLRLRPLPSAPRRASGERERERKGAFMRTTKLQIWLPSLSCLITAKK
ncbi:uncharacterized protein [Patagioenas fasciata]|uniref:uncharacterized protein n=1 Tax=Patagioenas fasciata TaxID=372321 RepID=UPI003A99AC24